VKKESDIINPKRIRKGLKGKKNKITLALRQLKERGGYHERLIPHTFS
jgi:hypothetical protein